jgi:hypothetical protein
MILGCLVQFDGEPIVPFLISLQLLHKVNYSLIRGISLPNSTKQSMNGQFAINLSFNYPVHKCSGKVDNVPY